MATNDKLEQLTEAQLAALVGARGDHRCALDAWEPGTPEYEEAEEELQHMKVTNPRMYTRIVNWD